MIGMLGNAYPWIKTAHLIFVIFWMAGLFMLPRYLVYHQEALAADGADSAEARLWIDREAKLRGMILTPSLFIVWGLGLLLAANLGLFSGISGLGWLHAKLLLVVVLSGYHGWAVSYGKRLAMNRAYLTGRHLRMLNELPAILVTLIVILVIVKPF